MNVQIALQQPSTSAKVILYTSHGQIELDLWAKQTPLASKNFIQHCLDGYYINTVFHRLIPAFMIQGGDPSGTGLGGQSIYGGPFKDEFHQRLKFTKRGILAMANSGKNTNQSQFFVTFGPCEHLNKKHTIFGKVVGDTIYNLMALQSLDTAQQDKPLDPPIIRKTKVIQNPFPDIKAKISESILHNKQTAGQDRTEHKHEQTSKKQNNKKQQLKKLKNKKKLTFENSEEEDEVAIQKVISSHEVLHKKDPGLSNKTTITKQLIQIKKKQKQIQQKKTLSLKNSINPGGYSEEVKLDEHQTKQNQRQMLKKRALYDKNTLGHDPLDQKDSLLNHIKRYNPTTNKYQIVFQDQLEREQLQKEKLQQLQKRAKEKQQISDQKLRQVRQIQLNQYNLLKTEQLNFKKAKQGSLKQKRKQIIQQQKKLLSNLEKHRYQFTQKLKINQHQGQIFKKLQDFNSRLKSIKTTSQIQPQNHEKNQGEQQQSTKQLQKSKIRWMNHKLKFHIDSANAYSLSDKGMKVNRSSFQDEDDGGLKMEVDENDLNQEKQKNIDDLLKNL